MQITNNTSHQLNAAVMDGGEQKAGFFAQIRPEKSLNVSLEIIDSAFANEHAQQIADAFSEFLVNALAEAFACDVPVNVIGTAAPAPEE